MKKLLPSQPLESLTVCGEPRAIDLTKGAGTRARWSDTEARLRSALSVGIP